VYDLRMLTYTASEARAKLPEIIDFVVGGQEISITRHGKPVVVVVSPEKLRIRRPAALEAIRRGEEIGRRIDEARGKPLLPHGGLPPGRADELVAEIRADRDRDPWVEAEEEYGQWLTDQKREGSRD
jgi:prevent-host-death family protein